MPENVATMWCVPVDGCATVHVATPRAVTGWAPHPPTVLPAWLNTAVPPAGAGNTAAVWVTLNPGADALAEEIGVVEIGVSPVGPVAAAMVTTVACEPALRPSSPRRSSSPEALAANPNVHVAAVPGVVGHSNPDTPDTPESDDTPAVGFTGAASALVAIEKADVGRAAVAGYFTPGTARISPDSAVSDTGEVIATWFAHSPVNVVIVPNAPPSWQSADAAGNAIPPGAVTVRIPFTGKVVVDVKPTVHVLVAPA